MLTLNSEGPALVPRGHRKRKKRPSTSGSDSESAEDKLPEGSGIATQHQVLEPAPHENGLPKTTEPEPEGLHETGSPETTKPEPERPHGTGSPETTKPEPERPHGTESPETTKPEPERPHGTESPETTKPEPERPPQSQSIYHRFKNTIKKWWNNPHVQKVAGDKGNQDLVKAGAKAVLSKVAQ